MMKKFLTLLGSVLLFNGFRTKAQNVQQPVKKETVQPVKGTAPKPDAAEIFLKLGSNPTVSKTSSGAKGSNPAFLKGANPSFVKNSGAVSTQQVAPRHTLPTGSQQVAPRHTPPPRTQQVAPRHKG